MSDPITISWMETETVERTVNKAQTVSVTPERFAELVASHAPAYVGSSPGDIIDSLYYSQPIDVALLDALASEPGVTPATITVVSESTERDFNGPSGQGKVEHDAEYDEDEDEETDDDEDEEYDEDDEEYDDSDDEDDED